jgi:hypothetical protein
MAQREKIGVKLLVDLGLDSASARRLEKDVESIHKRLSKSKVDWKSYGKAATMSVSEIKRASQDAKAVTDDLRDAIANTSRSVKSLNEKIRSAEKNSKSLKTALGKAKDPAERKEVEDQLADVTEALTGFQARLEDQKRLQDKYKSSLKDSSKAQDGFKKRLEAMNFSGKEMVKGLYTSFSKAGRGGMAGALDGIRDSIKFAKKGSDGASARVATGEGSMVGAGFVKAAGALGVVAVALGAFWQLLTKASQEQTKLNKALLAGAGTAQDMARGSSAYAKNVNDLRGASVAAHETLLKFGGTSETAAKAVNAFAKESTGSLAKARGTMVQIGRGDLGRGVAEFSKNAIVYGKALDMQAEEVAGMMGQFVSEIGYGAGQVQDLMGDVVKAAATSNMPLTKFMGIFRSVLPDTELYQNRLEELTGTIKLLSKTMSAKDVKNFMEAFSKGFGQTDFKQRLKTVLIAGTGFVSKQLDKDFNMKAKVMAKNFAQYGVNPKEFEKAYRGGTKSMAQLLSKTKGTAAQKGKEVDPTAISNAMKLAGYESARQKGGPLNLATAMRGASAVSTYKILKQQAGAFVSGFDGLSEHVIKQTGVTEQQYEALRTMDESMTSYRSDLNMYGKTASKSMNEGLREAIAMRKGVDKSQVTFDDMRKATEEDLIMAGELSNEQKSTSAATESMEDVAVKNMSLTNSIDEKIDNVLAFLLEKIYHALTPITDVLNELLEAAVSGDDVKERIRKRFQEDVDRRAGTAYKTDKAFDQRDTALAGAFVGGKRGKDFTDFAAGQFSPSDLKGTSGFVGDFVAAQLQQSGMSADDANSRANSITNEMTKGVMAGDNQAALGALSGLDPAMLSKTMEALSKYVAQQAADKKSRRDGTSKTEVLSNKKQMTLAAEGAKMAAESSDVETGLVALTKGGMDDPKAIAKARSDAEYGAIADQKAAAGASGAPTPEVKVQEEQAERQKKADEVQKDQLATVQSVDSSTNESRDILKNGIKFDSGFLSGSYKNTIKEATLDAFRIALFEFAILQARMTDDADFRGKLLTKGGEISAAKQDLGDVFDWSYGGTNESLKKILGAPGDVPEPGAPSKMVGGSITRDGLNYLHKGELVIPRAAVNDPRQQGRQGGGSTVVMNINGSTLSQQQLQSAVYGALDQAARRH